jgi:hypothetical protein
LQAGRNIRHIPERYLFLPSGAPHGPDHHQSGMDAKAERELDAVLTLQPGIQVSQGRHNP